MVISKKFWTPRLDAAVSVIAEAGGRHSNEYSRPRQLVSNISTCGVPIDDDLARAQAEPYAVVSPVT